MTAILYIPLLTKDYPFPIKRAPSLEFSKNLLNDTRNIRIPYETVNFAATSK